METADVKRLTGGVAADVAPAISSAVNEQPPRTSHCATSLLPRPCRSACRDIYAASFAPGQLSSPRIDAERRYRPVVVVGIHYLRCCYTASALLLESGRRASSCSLSTPASFFGSHRRVCPALLSGGWYAVAVHGAARDIFRAPLFIRVVGASEWGMVRRCCPRGRSRHLPRTRLHPRRRQ